MRAAACVLLLWVLGVARSDAADTWHWVVSANFTVASNAGEGTAWRTAEEFERVRAAYARVWPSGRLPQGKPTLVLALKNRDTLRRWAPGYFEVKGGIDVVSGSAEGADRQYLLVRTDWRPTENLVTPNYNLYRAYLGLLLRGSFERRLPLWLSSGLAEVLGNTWVSDDEIRVGRPVPWHFERFSQNARLPLQAILDARPDSPVLQKEAQRPQFDAQSYVLVHYLLYGDRGAHAAQLSQFVQKWLAGRSQDQAWSESLGTVAAVEAVLPNYSRTPLLPYARFREETKVDAQRSASRVLSPAEVAGLHALVHVAMQRPVEAQTALREARSADPSSPASFDAEGQLADRDRDEISATQAYARAVELGSTSAYSHYRAAQLAWKQEMDATSLARVRQLLERAIALNGSYANAYSYLAEVLVRQGEVTAALAMAERATSLEPGGSYHRLAAARVLYALGRPDDALRAVDLGLRLADSDAERSNAERYQLFLQQAAGYERDRAKQEAGQKRATACQSGDGAACAALVPEFDQRCGEKEADACLYLGWLYGQGRGLPKDTARSADYVARACAAGDKRACVENASAKARGDGVAKDEPGGLAALDTLCRENFLPACTRLALFLVARPGAAGRARARELLAQACKGGEADACSLAQQLN